MTITLNEPAPISPVTVWSAYEEDGEGELYTTLATAQQGAIGLWGKVCRENEEEPNGVYTWAAMKNGGWELLDGRDHTSVYVAEVKVHAAPVDYTAVRPCGCPARFERHSYGCKEA